MKALPHLPGRLGDPARSLGTDPRADRRMIAAMEPLGMAADAGPSPVVSTSPLEEILELCAQVEVGFEAAVDQLAAGLPPVHGVDRRVETITGPDGNEIKLHIHEPSDRTAPVPAVVHLHGGAMVAFGATGPGYQWWRDSLAARGLVVIGVEFRNGAGKHGVYPFPAGLDDCVAAARWVASHRGELGISAVVVSGESGGGNLTLATALRANRDGWVAEIDGVYAQCPYISNRWAEPDPALPSLIENDGYLLGCDQMGALAVAYDPSGAHATDAIAWPYHATADDLRGLPPHVISVNELDPLRDEGLAYFRKLVAADVPASSVTVNGTCHAGDCLFPAAMPEVARATLDAIAAFARSL